MENARQDRIRRLVRKANREKKKLRRQIDLLCNDYLDVQREFIGKLDGMVFTAKFYEQLIGRTDMAELLGGAADMVRKEIGAAEVAFFIAGQDGFGVHAFESGLWKRQRIEDFITDELARGVCQSNRVFTVDDLFEIGLGGNLSALGDAAVFAAPFGVGSGSGNGFMLVYREGEKSFSRTELSRVSGITRGLSRAVEAVCQATAAKPGRN